MVFELGGVDIVVNNAAYRIARMGGIADITTDQFDQVTKTNVYAMVWLGQKATPHLKPDRRLTRRWNCRYITAVTGGRPVT